MPDATANHVFPPLNEEDFTVMAGVNWRVASSEHRKGQNLQSARHDSKGGNLVLLPLTLRPENLHTLKAWDNPDSHRSTRHPHAPGGLSRANESVCANG